MINLLALLDTETTSTAPDAQCIEVAVSLFSVPHAAVVASFSSLIRADENPAFPINRISAGLLREAPPAETVWRRVEAVALRAEAIVAHNAEFDRRFVPEQLHRGRGPRREVVDRDGETVIQYDDLPWICSMDDIEWPRPQGPRPGLVKLALAHDLGVSHAHRAAVDVDLLARLFTRAVELGADLQAMLARAMRPKATYQALVPYERKDEAKEAGFGWDGETRAWVRRMAIEDAANLPFKVRELAA